MWYRCKPSIGNKNKAPAPFPRRKSRAERTLARSQVQLTHLFSYCFTFYDEVTKQWDCVLYEQWNMASPRESLQASSLNRVSVRWLILTNTLLKELQNGPFNGPDPLSKLWWSGSLEVGTDDLSFLSWRHMTAWCELSSTNSGCQLQGFFSSFILSASSVAILFSPTVTFTEQIIDR